MITVGQLIQNYIAKTETFIWQYLRNFQTIETVVLSQSYANENQFPLPNAKKVIIPSIKSRASITWVTYQIYKRFLGQPLGGIDSIDKYIYKHKIQLLHAHFGHVGATYRQTAQRTKIPLFTTFYGMDLSMQRSLDFNRCYYAGLFALGTQFLVEGPAMRGKLLELGCPEEKISIQHIAIVPDDYPYHNRTWDRVRPLRLLFIGRFTEKKGLTYALQAVAQVLEANPIPLEWHIIGDGPLKSELYQLAIELGIAERITWLGYQPHIEVIKQLDWTDLFIHPSVTAVDGDSEGGAPTILLEAQAAGIPILATTHADIPYVTVPTKSALLASERDIDALALNLKTLIAHPEIWSDMGRIGRKKVEQNHNVHKEVVKLEALYQEMLDRHNKSVSFGKRHALIL